MRRSTIYAKQTQKGKEKKGDLGEKREEELALLRLVDEEYTRHPFYGSRRMVVFLRVKGYSVSRKRVQRLMRLLGQRGMAPGPDRAGLICLDKILTEISVTLLGSAIHKPVC